MAKFRKKNGYKKFYYRQLDYHYCYQGKSYNAQLAEADGGFNKSNITTYIVGKISSIIGKKLTVKKLKELITNELITTNEWHHTGMYGQRTPYYNVEDVANQIVSKKLL